MTFARRIKLTLGILVVLALAGALLLYLNESMANVRSTKATLQADSFSVGTSYSGSITDQYVQVGDTVSKGQKLFKISSDVFNSDLASGRVNQSDVSFQVSEDNAILLLASSSGVVQSIDYLQGAFVPANKEIAKITRTDSTYVLADYYLTSKDYARVSNGSRVTVTLPNDKQVDAKVFLLSIESNNGRPKTVIKARLAQSEITKSLRIASGTPVEATLHLSGETLWAKLKNRVDAAVN